jgi:hypothetical protein
MLNYLTTSGRQPTELIPNFPGIKAKVAHKYI